MKEFNVIHKYCGYEMVISGYDFYDAMKKHNLNHKYWIKRGDNND